METILESPYWTSKNSMRDTITKATTETCLMELALHEPKEWDQWAKKMIDAYNENYTEKLECTSRELLIRKSATSEEFW